MSKLGESIRRALRTESSPMGFAAASTRVVKPSLLVAAVFTSFSTDRAREAISQGADTCLFAVSDPKDTELQEILKALGETPAGLLPRRVERPSLERLAELGLDYVAFEPDAAPASALLHPRIGRVLVLENDLPDSYLRTLEAMPVEALFLRSWKADLSVRAQMELQRIVGLSRKPLAFPVSPDIEGLELEALREAGVALLTIDGERRENLELLPALKTAIERLPARRRRQEERPEAILPSPQAVAAVEEAEEEGDEEEWEP